MPTARHTFAACDTDSDDAVRSATAFVAGQNLFLEIGNITPATGNVLVPYALPPTGTTRSLGGFADGATGTAVHLLYNEQGAHRLVRYDPTGNAGAGSLTTLLEWRGLNLSPTGTYKDAVNGGILDGLLLYLDADGECRCVNLARAASGGYPAAYLAAEPFALHLVKVPPTGVLQAARVLAATGAPGEGLRLIQGRAYQFSYRFRYVDGELTLLAPYSTWLDVLDDPSAVTFNTIVLTLPSQVPTGVLEIELLVREPDSAAWEVADVLRRDGSGSFPAAYNFYGQRFGGAVTQDDTTRLFESLWPAGTLTLARSRAHVAGQTEGYPTPQPAFTANVVSGDEDSTYRADLYELTITDTQPSDQYPGETQAVYRTYYFLPLTGTYPDPASTYQPVQPQQHGSTTAYLPGGDPVSYDQAFNTYPQPGIVNETDRQVAAISQALILRPGVAAPGPATFHERSTYRVAVQFFDALGRPYGVSEARTVSIPAQDKANPVTRRIRAILTTTDPAALNVEIPGGAYSYQWVVARNDRTTYFLQGVAADVFAYKGQKTVINPDTGQQYDEPNLDDVIHTAHEQIAVDIGNFTAVGQGYVWGGPGSGDTVLLLNENREYPIVGQRGEYLLLQTSTHPDQSIDSGGHTVARIEIYSPNRNPSSIYYERGPRLRVLRDPQGNRSYEQATVTLEGDCYLVSLTFPLPDRNNTDPDNDSTPLTYYPPATKTYTPGPAVLVESMVPRYRLAPTSTTRTTVYEGHSAGGFFGRFFTGLGDVLKNGTDIGQGYTDLLRDLTNRAERRTTEVTADTAARTAANLVWLDMSFGGRPALRVPAALQQVNRPALERFSGVRVAGTLLNGLSRWEALNQYDELPQEQGPVTTLVLADQAQTNGSVLLALQERGLTSLYLGQQPIRADPQTQLLSITRQVIGGDNVLQGGYGCQDAASVVAYAGKVFYWCRERQELVRYRNGLTLLGEAHKFRRRLQAAARLYGAAPVRGCFDPRRQEYLLTFDPLGELPGLTLVWSERHEAWADGYAFAPEAGQALGNELLAWQAGALWRHVPTAPAGTFFGQYAPAWVRFTTASPDGLAKRWMSLAQRTEGGAWNADQLTTDTGQASRTRPPEWERREGVQRLREGLRRDELTRGFASPWQARDEGSPLVAPRLTTTLVCPADAPQPLASVEVGWLPRAGQTNGVST